MPEPCVPTQNASTSSSVTPDSESTHSVTASTSRSSAEDFQWSRNGVQPIATIATSWAMRLLAIDILPHTQLPEVVVDALGAPQAPERRRHRHADDDVAGRHV